MKKRLCLILLSVVGVAFIFTKVFPPSGFCTAEFRFPSDEEYITKVLAMEFVGGEMLLSKEDTSPLAYYHRHPNCCSVSRKNSIWDYEVSLFDTDFVSVDVTYTPTQTATVSYSGNGQHNRQYSLSKFYLTTGCGDPIGNPSSLLEHAV